jgi:two-component system LytT family response regulator
MNNMSIKAIIIDDERLARNELKKLLEQHPEIQIMDEASGVEEGIEKVDLARPDLIFLDIHAILRFINCFVI